MSGRLLSSRSPGNAASSSLYECEVVLQSCCECGIPNLRSCRQVTALGHDEAVKAAANRDDERRLTSSVVCVSFVVVKKLDNNSLDNNEYWYKFQAASHRLVPADSFRKLGCEMTCTCQVQVSMRVGWQSCVARTRGPPYYIIAACGESGRLLIRVIIVIVELRSFSPFRRDSSVQRMGAQP
jgi:hypothetical protein